MQITPNKCIHFSLKFDKLHDMSEENLKTTNWLPVDQDCTKPWMSQFSNMSIMYALYIKWETFLNMFDKIEQVQEIITLDLKFLFEKRTLDRKVSRILVP